MLVLRRERLHAWEVISTAVVARWLQRASQTVDIDLNQITVNRQFVS